MFNFSNWRGAPRERLGGVVGVIRVVMVEGPAPGPGRASRAWVPAAGVG